MKYTLPVPLSTVLDKTGIICTQSVYYNAIEMKVTISHTYSGDTGHAIYVYIFPKLDVYDTEGTISCVFGILNGNGNMCRKEALDYTFTPADTSGRGHCIYKYQGTSIDNYSIDNTINFCVEIKEYTTRPNDSILLKRIYASLNPETTVLLQSQCDALRAELDKLQERHDALQARYDELSSKHIEPRVTPVQVVKVIEADPKNMSKEELYNLQERITEALKRLGTCPVCLDLPNNLTLVPCGHQCCTGCSSALQTCPVCRAVIERKVKTY